MLTLQEKPHCVVWFTETQPDLRTLSKFWSQYWRPPHSLLTQPLLHEGHKKLMETESVLWQREYGHASTSPENVE